MGAAVALCLLVVGCKKTVKGESRRWEAGQKKVSELAVRYPGFAAALEQQRGKARAIYDAAQGVSGDEAKAKKLSEANTQLVGGFVGKLDALDGKIKGLRQSLVAAGGVARDAPERGRVDAATTEVKRSLDKVDALLKQGGKDVVAAGVIVDQANGELDLAARMLADAMPKAAPPTTAKQGATTPPPDNQPKPWTCEYCDHVNDPDAKTCANCGAPRPNPAPPKSGATTP